MTSEEFDHWMCWARIRGPFGERRADIRNAMLMLQAIQIATGGKSKAKIETYLPFEEKQKAPPATQEQIAEQIEALQQVFGREVD